MTWEDLNRQAVELFQSGKYAEAIAAGKEALEEAEKSFGPEDPRVARALNNLAEMHRAKVQDTDAEPLWKRGLDIRIKALGPLHPDVATSLNNLAGAYFEQGRLVEADNLIKKAVEVLEKALGPGHADVATSLLNRVAVNRAMGRLPAAKPLYERAIAIQVQTLGANSPQLGSLSTIWQVCTSPRCDFAMLSRSIVRHCKLPKTLSARIIHT